MATPGEIADAYERGWDECLDAAREVVRGAADVKAALARLDVLAHMDPPRPATHEPGA